jgi:tyrosyl-tRNA synthetase
MIPSLTTQLLEVPSEEDLANITNKMSSSDSDSKIEITETVKTIRKKINKAYLQEGNGRSPIFDFVRYVIFPINKLLNINQFIINRDEKWGGIIVFNSIEDLIKTFEEKILSPQDLKLGIADWIIDFLNPIREYFEVP